MTKKIAAKYGVFSLALLVCAGLFCQVAAGQQQRPPKSLRDRFQDAPASASTVDGSEAMFTVMCALYASGYEADVSADNWTVFRAQMRERMRAQKGPAVEAVRAFYQQHVLSNTGEMLSRYVWFGLVAGHAPKFQPVLRRDELPPEVLELDGFTEILAAYYKEQQIGSLWQQVQPVYNREIARLHDPISQVVLVANSYLRQLDDPAEGRTFTIVVEPLVGRITNVRNYGDHYAIILSGGEEIPVDTVRHAYLHFLLDSLPMSYSHVVVVKRPLYEAAAKAPRLPVDLRDDYISWFAECLVRAVDLKLKMRKASPSEKEAALTEADVDGYTLERPIYMQLAEYEKAEPSMKNYFPDLVRGIDLKTEMAREATIKFAPRRNDEADTERVNQEAVARRKAALPKTVPDDQSAISELTEGEKQIAAHNARGAETSFKSVLQKYPDQTRAWFGLGVVALMDHDGPRAKEVFGRLTSGDHAATQDPMVLAWSHVYLGRVLEDEGDLARAKDEYTAALGVQGAPTQAQQAAQKGLGDLALRK